MMVETQNEESYRTLLVLLKGNILISNSGQGQSESVELECNRCYH